MAVTLSIPLTDAEQATVSSWLDEVRPGLTNAEKKSLLESHARRLLRDDLLERRRELRATTARQAELDARSTEADALTVVDVFAEET